MDTIASNLRSARLRAGMTQEQLAEAAGVSQTTIDKIEQGKTLRSRYLPYIARALDIDLSELDPEIKKSKDSLKRLPAATGNIYTYRTPETIPLFTYNSTTLTPEINFADEPPGFLETAVLANDINAYGVMVVTDLMSPELEYGDAAIFETRGPLLPGSTGIFHHRDSARRQRIIGRFLRTTETHWVIRCWRMAEDIELSHEDWPVMHRMMTRFTRR